MNFIKNKTFWGMFLIVILGAFFRLLFIDKPEGLWNDEYISWQIASVPLGKGFVKAVFSQCHMPFYYLYLKFFMFLGGSSDLLLRFTSVFAGLLSIVAMFFVGKEYKSEKLGLICALFAAVSSFLIYYSQEVRIYQILFFFSALSLLYTLKLAKNKNIVNVVLYLFSNFLILFTHTIGFVYVFFNAIFMSFLLVRENPEYKKKLLIGWCALFVSFCALSPLVASIFSTRSFSQWWGHFTVSRIGFLFTDYFSPVLINLVNAPDNFFFNFNFSFILFALIPALIAIFGIYSAVRKKDYLTLGLCSVAFATLLVLSIASIFGKLVFITKYSIEIYPILILLSAYGLVFDENNKFKKILLVMFLILNISYILINPNSAPKMRRNEGHKIVADLLNNAKLNSGDIILINYYGAERFYKYFDFKDQKIVSINKGNFNFFMNPVVDMSQVLVNGKSIYKDSFSTLVDTHFTQVFEDEILSKLKSNQKVSIVFLNTVSMFSPVEMQKITQNDNYYKKAPLLFLVFSHMKNLLIKEGMANLSILRAEQKGSWTVVTFVRK